jgi:hypothetical protein
VVVVFVNDAIGSVSASASELFFWLRIQWVGIVSCQPACTSPDALLAAESHRAGDAGWLSRVSYLISGIPLLPPYPPLIGQLVQKIEPRHI